MNRRGGISGQRLPGRVQAQGTMGAGLPEGSVLLGNIGSRHPPSSASRSAPSSLCAATVPAVTLCNLPPRSGCNLGLQARTGTSLLFSKSEWRGTLSPPMSAMWGSPLWLSRSGTGPPNLHTKEALSLRHQGLINNEPGWLRPGTYWHCAPSSVSEPGCSLKRRVGSKKGSDAFPT